MNNQIKAIHDALSQTFLIPVFENEITESEEIALFNTDYHCFVYQTSDIKKMDDLKTINQDVFIYYYSEKRTDIDSRTVDIIRSLKDVKQLNFRRSQKQRLKKDKTNLYMDRVIFHYTRRINLGCQI